MFLATTTIFVMAMTQAVLSHKPELIDIHREAMAECIAIVLDGQPKKAWLPLATEYAKDPGLCKKVMAMPNKINLPMHGSDWRDRLDVGRSAMQP